MSKPFIHVDKKKHGDYARIFYPKWENNKKIVKTENLGRVIDLEKGLFKSRDRGEFYFNFETGFTPKEPLVKEPEIEIKSNEQALMFGNVYVANELLHKLDFYNLFRKIYPGNEDTLLTLILFRLLIDGLYDYVHS
jgi:hypothetical protein